MAERRRRAVPGSYPLCPGMLCSSARFNVFSLDSCWWRTLRHSTSRLPGELLAIANSSSGVCMSSDGQRKVGIELHADSLQLLRQRVGQTKTKDLTTPGNGDTQLATNT